MHDDVLDRLTTLAMLGHALREARTPPPAALELTLDGWQVWDGESFDPVPVHADMAWVIAERNERGSGEEILNRTRQLCGDLRIASKRRHVCATKRREYEQTLADLRAGLKRVRDARAGAFRDPETHRG